MTTEEKLKNHLDEILAPYGSLEKVKELKEELLSHLMEKLRDMRTEGYAEERAFDEAVASLAGVSEIVESMNQNLGNLAHLAAMRFSGSNLKNSDFSSITAPQKQFDYSNLEGSKFSHSDLQGCSFKWANLSNADFDRSNLRGASFKGTNLTNVTFKGADLTGAMLQMSNLKGASFENSRLDNTDFGKSNLSGVSFDGQSIVGAVFDNANLRDASFRNTRLSGVSFRTDVKKTAFAGASMDKLTYAVLKGHRADLTNVTVE